MKRLTFMHIIFSLYAYIGGCAWNIFTDGVDNLESLEATAFRSQRAIKDLKQRWQVQSIEENWICNNLRDKWEERKEKEDI